MKKFIYGLAVGLGFIALSALASSYVFPQQGGLGAYVTPSPGVIITATNTSYFVPIYPGNNGDVLTVNTASDTKISWKTPGASGGGGNFSGTSTNPNAIFYGLSDNTHAASSSQWFSFDGNRQIVSATGTATGTAFNSLFTSRTTSDLAEGANLYHTDARVNTLIDASGTMPIIPDGGLTGVTLLQGTRLLSATSALAVNYGGTGLTSGNSGGIPYFSGANTLASSLTLPSGAILFGGGAGVGVSFTQTPFYWDNNNRRMGINYAGAPDSYLSVSSYYTGVYATSVTFVVSNTATQGPAFVIKDNAGSQKFIVGVNGTVTSQNIVVTGLTGITVGNGATSPFTAYNSSCSDSSGNHLNYSGGVISCGTSASYGDTNVKTLLNASSTISFPFGTSSQYTRGDRTLSTFNTDVASYISGSTTLPVIPATGLTGLTLLNGARDLTATSILAQNYGGLGVNPFTIGQGVWVNSSTGVSVSSVLGSNYLGTGGTGGKFLRDDSTWQANPKLPNVTACTSGCDAATIQAGLYLAQNTANFPNGATLFLPDTTYTYSNPLTVTTDKITIQGNWGGTKLAFNPASSTAAAIRISGTVTGLVIRNLLIVQNASVNNTGTAMELGNGALGKYENIRTSGFARSINLNDTANNTFYNTFRDIASFDDNCITVSSTNNVNDNNFSGIRCAFNNGNNSTVTTYGLFINKGQHNNFYSLNAEPGHSTMAVGVELISSSVIDTNIYGLYAEANATSVIFASGSARNSIWGAEICCYTSTNGGVIDNGTNNAVFMADDNFSAVITKLPNIGLTGLTAGLPLVSNATALTTTSTLSTAFGGTGAGVLTGLRLANSTLADTATTMIAVNYGGLGFNPTTLGGGIYYNAATGVSITSTIASNYLGSGGGGGKFLQDNGTWQTVITGSASGWKMVSYDAMAPFGATGTIVSSSSTYSGAFNLGLNPGAAFASSFLLTAVTSSNSGAEGLFQNISSGASAAMSLTLENNIGTDTDNYINYGIGSSGYNNASYPLDWQNASYLESSNDAGLLNISVSSYASNPHINLTVGKTYATSTISVQIEDVSVTGVALRALAGIQANGSVSSTGLFTTVAGQFTSGAIAAWNSVGQLVSDAVQAFKGMLFDSSGNLDTNYHSVKYHWPTSVNSYVAQISVTGTIGVAVFPGRILYLNTYDNKYYTASATVASTTPASVVATDYSVTGSTGVTLMKQGWFAYSSATFAASSVKAVVVASEDSNTSVPTQILPQNTGDIVERVGLIEQDNLNGTDIVYFNFPLTDVTR